MEGSQSRAGLGVFGFGTDCWNVAEFALAKEWQRGGGIEEREGERMRDIFPGGKLR